MVTHLHIRNLALASDHGGYVFKTATIGTAIIGAFVVPVADTGLWAGEVSVRLESGARLSFYEREAPSAEFVADSLAAQMTEAISALARLV